MMYAFPASEVEKMARLLARWHAKLKYWHALARWHTKLKNWHAFANLARWHVYWHAGTWARTPRWHVWHTWHAI